MKPDEIRPLEYADFVEYVDFVYESRRDPDKLDFEAESAYQKRQYRKLKRTMAEDDE